MILTPLKISILMIAIFIPIVVTANNLTDQEKEIRKYVSRTYQLTDGALARCPSNYANTFEVTLNKFKSTYPELMNLVNNSKYYQRGVNNFSDDIERSKNEPQEKLYRECQYMEHLLKTMLNTENGKLNVEEAIKILQN